ncbi:MAG TPA: DNA ligase D [Myxococcaceae bacterium]|nr:DNA ligase D [Myxococcaceae bacterium]
MKKDARPAGSGERPRPTPPAGAATAAREPSDARATAAAVRAELEKLGAPRQRVPAAEVDPMLAETREQPFSARGWLYELKYDGFRCIAGREGARVWLGSRNGRELTGTFPELARAVAGLPFEHVVLDGEVVVLDEESKPSFGRLQKRGMLSRPAEIERATVTLPAVLFVFDLLGFEDFDLRPLPLFQRKALLRRVLPPEGALRYADHLEEHGAEMFEQVRALGLEGVMAKKADARYRGGRSADWLKVRAARASDFVVVGYSPIQAGTGVGALHLAAHEGGQLVYAGKVGSGFSDALRDELKAALDQRRRKGPACTGAPDPRGVRWVEPERVCEVRYLTWLDGGHVRQPVFLRMRDDKRPAECVRDRDVPPPPPQPAAPSPPPAPVPSARQVAFSNLDKVYWPGDGYTKGDLISFYREVSPWLLPYLKDRPLVMTRFPDGIDGKSFFQKDVPDHAPAWVRTAQLHSSEDGRRIEYVLCDDVETLLYVANLGSIPLHVWASRVARLEHPDWCILDLDPKEAPFEHVLTLARAIHALCEELGLPAYPKTSGQKGMHVLIPLGGQCTHHEAKVLGELLAKVIEAEHPTISSTARAIGDRGGKVYLDFLQNGHGKTLVAPFSVRPKPGAPVSTPLKWSEVNARLNPADFTIQTVVKRFKRLKADPLRPVLEEKADLPGALARLAGRLKG